MRNGLFKGNSSIVHSGRAGFNITVEEGTACDSFGIWIQFERERFTKSSLMSEILC
jgi:hypothetical protein